MLRKCKLEVVVAESVHCYNEITKSKEDFIMKLSDKIVRLRKSNGMSQEELAGCIEASHFPLGNGNSYARCNKHSSTQ